MPRAFAGLPPLIAARKRLLAMPRGDGRPVLLLPGLVNSDRSTIVLRRYLNALGYRAEGWGLGLNLGSRTIGADGKLLFERIRKFHAETGQRVTLIGISLGGIMARLAAHRVTDAVREVITISSPYAGHPRATNVWRVFELVSGEKVDAARVTSNAPRSPSHYPSPPPRSGAAATAWSTARSAAWRTNLVAARSRCAAIYGCRCAPKCWRRWPGFWAIQANTPNRSC